MTQPSMPRPRVRDPRAVPVAGTDAHLPALPASALTADALRRRFAEPADWSPELAGLGYVFSYAAPMIAGLALGRRPAMLLMLLNTLGFLLAVQGFVWPQFPPEWVRLPDTPFYLHGSVFAFFNIALPLAVFRLGSGMRVRHARLARSLGQVEDVLQGFGAPILVCDEQDRIVAWNERYVAMHPWLRPVLRVGEPFVSLLEPAARNVIPDDPTGEARRAWMAQRLERHLSGTLDFEQQLASG